MSDAPIKLPGRIRRSEAVKLYEDIIRIPLDQDLTFDAAEVEDIGTAMIAMILAAQADRTESGAKVKVLGAGAPFTDAFSDLGLFSDMMKLEFV